MTTHQVSKRSSEYHVMKEEHQVKPRSVMNSPKSTGHTNVSHDLLASKMSAHSPCSLAIWSQFSGDHELP